MLLSLNASEGVEWDELQSKVRPASFLWDLLAEGDLCKGHRTCISSCETVWTISGGSGAYDLERTIIVELDAPGLVVPSLI